jgi:hypothetical protein
MKRMLLVLLVFTLVFGLAAWAGSGKAKTSSADKSTTVNGYVVDEKCGAKGANDKAAGCSKKCIEGGQKAVLVQDSDGSVLAIDNQDAIKGHEGHHVAVTGHVDSAKKSIHIADVKMVAAAKS